MHLMADGVSMRYMRPTGEANHFYAVREVTLTLEGGTLTMLTGRSGSGKTTLLHLLSGLLCPTEGRVLLDDTSLYAMQDEALSRYRNIHLAVIPQGRAAVASLSVVENVLLPCGLYGHAPSEAEVLPLMERLGLGNLLHADPAELSGGELRRMSIARAIAQNADVLLADEPTGDLDDENTETVLRLLREEADRGKAVLLVTHEQDAARFADTVFRMDGGRCLPA